MTNFALISVWDKTGVVEIAEKLLQQGLELLSTGGTYRELSGKLGTVGLHQVSDFTGAEEILDGRVKTLHPKIHGGILARDDQLPELKDRGLSKISVVIVNLYPFKETVASGSSEEQILENIDIGGHTLIRAAAKNYSNTLILVDPEDYQKMHNVDELTIANRRQFAAKALAHATEYDIAISQWFGDQSVRKFYPLTQLKYGCNPYQDKAYLCFNEPAAPFEILNWSVGYINLMDALLGFQLVCEAKQLLDLPIVASYKHTSPAGVGAGHPLNERERLVFDAPDNLTAVGAAFVRARNCDPLSSFGDFLAFSDIVDICAANLIKREVSDGIIAPGYTSEALEILKQKKSGKYTILQLEPSLIKNNRLEYREIAGFALAQTPNRMSVTTDDLQVVTDLQTMPQTAEFDLLLANVTLKYTQSNSVAYAYNGQVIGIGAGQQNRVDCVKLAGQKARRWIARFTSDATDEQAKLKASGLKRTDLINALWDWLNSNNIQVGEYPLCLASDAFFPFPDSIIVAAGYGVKYISQPGGSMGDQDCIKEANHQGIVMAMTGKRLFLH
jgi:phosphoribosylaminoimidazolecarboxamide formyltransferase / IMP cyclohydrolase